MSVQIRICRLEDAAAIYRLNKEQMGYDYPLPHTAEKLSLLLAKESDRVLVAEVDGQVAGYIHLCSYDVLYMPPSKTSWGSPCQPNTKSKASAERCWLRQRTGQEKQAPQGSAWCRAQGESAHINSMNPADIYRQSNSITSKRCLNKHKRL